MPLSAGTLASLSAAVANGKGAGDLDELPKFLREQMVQNFKLRTAPRQAAPAYNRSFPRKRRPSSSPANIRVRSPWIPAFAGTNGACSMAFDGDRFRL
jgi:hypothetical protein